jgi:hypothetical protein
MSVDSNPRKTALIYAALASVCFGAFIVASIVTAVANEGVPIGAVVVIVIGTVFAAVAGNYWTKHPMGPGDRKPRG